MNDTNLTQTRETVRRDWSDKLPARTLEESGPFDLPIAIELGTDVSTEPCSWKGTVKFVYADGEEKTEKIEMDNRHLRLGKETGRVFHVVVRSSPGITAHTNLLVNQAFKQSQPKHLKQEVLKQARHCLLDHARKQPRDRRFHSMLIAKLLMTLPTSDETGK